MTARHLDPDAAFFAEWAARRPGQRRDLDRAEKIAAELGAFPVGVPVLTVVGSKGKGTAAVNAAAALAAHRRADGQHLRVGLVTSPAHRTNTERIRLDGLSIAEATYAQIAAGLTAARHAVDVTDGYLSPTGAFTVAGVAWLHRRCDVLVVEEGLGGASDEVSLFAPDVVALTEVFVEHAALLGDSPGAIAADLLAVVRAGTSAVVTGPQSPSVTTVVRHVARRTGAQVHQVPSGHPRRSDELAQANRALGVQAAAELARRHRWTATDADIEAVLATVRTPGRGSWHRWRGADIMVDGAISPTGVRAAAVQHTETTGRLAHAVLCLPDDKDVLGCLTELRTWGPVELVTAGTDHLPFTTAERVAGHPLRDSITAVTEAADTGTCLAVGTQSMVGEVLELLDVDTDRVYTPQATFGGTPCRADPASFAAFPLSARSES